MAFTTGLITSPSPAVGWSLGNVATPEWANLVSGNLNGLMAGTGPTLGSLYVDGVGGASYNIGTAHLAARSFTTNTLTIGAGSGGSGTATGGDTAGRLTTTTGGAPTAGATILTMTFNSSWASSPAPVTPYAVIFPGNAAAANLTAAQQPYVTTTTTAMTITATGALAAGILYAWNYIVIGG